MSNLSGPCGDGLWQKWFDDEKDRHPLLTALLPAAAEALYTEDRQLFAAFGASPSRDKLTGLNQGLGYWLFETTLAYVVFRAWLRCGWAIWESKYEKQNRIADLVVVDSVGGNLVFEAKWWMSNSTSALVKDMGKIREWRHAKGRYLMAFWHSPFTQIQWDRDLAQVISFCGKEAQLTYMATFPTDVAATRTPEKSGSYFAFAVMQV